MFVCLSLCLFLTRDVAYSTIKYKLIYFVNINLSISNLFFSFCFSLCVCLCFPPKFLVFLFCLPFSLFLINIFVRFQNKIFHLSLAFLLSLPFLFFFLFLSDFNYLTIFIYIRNIKCVCLSIYYYSSIFIVTVSITTLHFLIKF